MREETMPTIGDIIDGTFRIVRWLGEGAAGTAYEVSLTRDWGGHLRGKTLCLKWHKDGVFKKEPADTVIARRVREIKLFGTLNHPHIVKVHETSEFWVGGIPAYVIMDLVDGKTLEDVAKGVQIKSEDVQRILLAVAQGLKVMHDRQIIHRDVKAANVMIDSMGRVILMDLGVARPESDATMTNSQAFLGTLRFAAPEWLFAESCTSASDVYSLGTIALHLLTGKEIFADITLFSRLVEAVRDRDPTISTAGWDLRRQYLAILTSRMLTKRPEHRPTLDEVIEFLTDEKQFQAWANVEVVWARLEEAGFFRQLQEHFGKDGGKQRVFASAVLTAVPESELLQIVEQKDLKRLLSYDPIRRDFNFMTFDEREADYLAHPIDQRAACAAAALRSIAQDESISEGTQIEDSRHLINQLYGAESSEEVKLLLKPLLEQAEADMDAMIQLMIQENPSDDY